MFNWNRWYKFDVLMKIGLLDIDGMNYPNLALMKISAYHKAIGDDVSWCLMGEYDRTYISKVFTFNKEHISPFADYGEIIKGGTGYNLDELPNHIDKLQPDYSIYPQFKSAYGFLTRGCPNKCSWCIVPKKEGNIRPYMDIEEIAQDRKEVVLMDNNVLASDWGLQQIEKAIKLNLKLDFNQGLDARLISNNIEIAELLAKIKWIQYIRLACDSDSMISIVINTMNLLISKGISKWKFNIYLLLNKDIKSAYKRAIAIKNTGATIIPQPYRDFTPNQIIPQWQKDFARWGSKKQLYRTCDFKDYQPRKGFICSKYF